MEEAIETLKGFGLTLVQAKVYLSLAASSSLNIASISECSKVPRTDLYRVLHELEAKGLVEKILTNPVEYCAISLNDCLDVLTQARTKESFELQNRAAKLRAEFAQKNHPNNGNMKPKFVLVPSNRILEKISASITGSSEHIDLLVSWKRLACGVSLFDEALKGAWERKVACRILTNYPQENGLSQLTLLRKSPCGVRFLDSPPETILGLYDNKEVFIIEDPYAGLSESSALWSNNSSLTTLVQQYFEQLWKTAKEDTLKKLTA